MISRSVVSDTAMSDSTLDRGRYVALFIVVHLAFNNLSNANKCLDPFAFPKNETKSMCTVFEAHAFPHACSGMNSKTNLFTKKE